MGQKVNPIGFRLGVNRGWDSIWFSKKHSEKFPQKIRGKNPTKISNNKKSDKKICEKNLKKNLEKIKSIDFGVKHIQRRAPNSFSALRTSPIKIETIFGKLLETATQPIFKEVSERFRVF